MGHGIEGARKDKRNGEGSGINVQGSDAVGAVIWQQELCGDQGDAQGTGGVPPLGGAMDHRNDEKAQGRQRVVVPIVSGGDVIRRDTINWGEYQEATDNHSGKGGLQPHLCNVYGGRTNARDEPVGAIVRSRHDKRTWGVDEEKVWLS